MKCPTEHISDIGSVRKNTLGKNKQEKQKIHRKYNERHKTHSCIYDAKDDDTYVT